MTFEVLRLRIRPTLNEALAGSQYLARVGPRGDT